MAGLPTGTVTLLFTDVEGSTQLLRQLGDRYSAVLDEHRALLRGAFQTAGGREVATQGDASFAAFGRSLLPDDRLDQLADPPGQPSSMCSVYRAFLDEVDHGRGIHRRDQGKTRNTRHSSGRPLSACTP